MPHYLSDMRIPRDVRRREVEIEATDRDRAKERKRDREKSRFPIAAECRFHDDLEILERNLLSHATVITVIANAWSRFRDSVIVQ